MYERLLDKNTVPSEKELLDFCGENGARFDALNRFLTEQVGTEKSVRFPYGNKYGWCITHRKKK